MWKKVLLCALVGVLTHYALWYRDWLAWSVKHMYRVTPGPCQVVIKDGGAEDVIYIGDGIFLASTGVNWNSEIGSIKAIDVNELIPVVKTLNISNSPSRGDFFTASHGISSWIDPKTGQLLLYVITHRPSQDVVEVLEVVKSPLSLRYLRSITDPSFTFMNDLVVVGLDQFYITRYSQLRAGWTVLLEHLLHLPTGRIFFYDGKNVKDTGGTYFMPNGINVSKDRKTLFVASWGEQSLYAFKIGPNMGLTKLWKEHYGYGLDNIDVNEDGSLWIGCHPITWRLVDFLGLAGSRLPSQVLRVKLKNNAISETEIIYSDNGKEIQGSTSAVFADGKMVVGSISAEAIVCNVPYLSS